jgi:DNA-binding response OmpR family regulator
MTRQPCVLIVESDVLVRHPLAQYLRECGYRALEAQNSSEARAILERHPKAVDVVLADADGGEESGFALANWIRQSHSAIEVILAGSVAKATEKAGDLCQDGPNVTKPYEHHLVLQRIRRLLAQREANKPGT